ncbi:MAG: hypothetical protein RIF36_07465 [Imperialibacter sp.]
MNVKTIYKTLIWVGLLLFIARIVGDEKAIEYLRYGRLSAPSFLVLGQ